MLEALSLDELVAAIERADLRYYNGSEPEVSDLMYDGWKIELKKRDPDHPLLLRVGAAAPRNSPLVEVPHRIPMDSLDNAMNLEEFRAWYARSVTPDEPQLLLSCGYKMDGMSADLRYEEGVLVRALTRGNGKVGLDITHNARHFKQVPARAILPSGDLFTGSIRGECVLMKKDWLELDTDPPESNPRSMGNGIINREDDEQAGRISFFAFRMYTEDGKPVGTMEADMYATLERMKFTTAPFFAATAVGTAEMEGWWQTTNSIRITLPFEIDGLVVSAAFFKTQRSLGSTEKYPRWAIAWKFPPMGGPTKLKSVDISVGHTGAIIPTGEIDPIRIGGVTVTRATLHNWNKIEQMNVAVGDTVLAVRSGDVIPAIEDVLERPETRQPIPRPTECPCPLKSRVSTREKIDGDQTAAIYCCGPADGFCPWRLKGRLVKWCEELEIEGLSSTYVNLMVDQGWIHTPADLYLLTTEKLATLVGETTPTVGVTRATGIVASIQSKRVIPLAQFLGALGIEGLGRRRAEKVIAALPEEFNTLEKWRSGNLVKHADSVSLPNLAAKIQIQLDEAGPFINGVLECVTVEQASAFEEKGFLFCITGKLSQGKEHFHRMIRDAGHRHTDTYNKKVTYLVAADPNGKSGKLDKARKDNVAVISEQELLNVLRNESVSS